MAAKYIQPAQEDDGALLHWRHWVHRQPPITIWYAATTPWLRADWECYQLQYAIPRGPVRLPP